MILIRNISKKVTDKLLFENFSLTIQNTGRVGIVGPNGSGKTTLLKMIAGLDFPDTGDIETGHERIGFLEQTMPEDDSLVTIGHYFRHYKPNEVAKILDALTLPYNENKTIASHSGGEQTKIQLAKVLLDRPSCLILDEPTNHLEHESCLWLAEFLRNFHGTILAVSHDRKFLNDFASVILETDPVNTCIHTYHGNYDDFKIAKEQRMLKWQQDFENQQKELRRMQEFIKEKQRQAHMSDDPAKGRQIRQMKKRMEREIFSQAILRPKDTLKIKQAELQGEGHDGKLILRAKDLGFQIGEKEIFRSVNLTMRGKDRVHLLGPNGSGKSTFIKLSLGETSPSSGTITLGENVRPGYFDQTHGELPGDKSLLDWAASLSGKGDDRAFLAKYGFVGIHVNKLIKHLSQGEQVRLIFAKLLLDNYDLLILDEPTNHLDIESREVIENALKEYQGSLLVVSHDQYFVEQIGMTKQWQITNANIKESLV